MSCCTADLAEELARSGQAASSPELLHEVTAAARQRPDGTMDYLVSVPAIHCGACIGTVEDRLHQVEGLLKVRANLTLKRVTFTMAAHGNPEPVLQALAGIGYPGQSVLWEGGDADGETRYFLRCLAVAGFAFANIMLLSVSVWSGADASTRDMFHFLSGLIAIPAVAYAGMPFFRSALAALSRRQMNMDVPISLGVTLAAGMSLYESIKGGHNAYFDAAVSLLFFLLIGRTLDHVMRNRARDAVGRLSRFAAKGGMAVEEDGGLRYVPLDTIRPGLRLRVAAGERFPVDARIIEGRSDVDRSFVSGESDPVSVFPGQFIEGGTLNLTGSVDVLAEKPAGESFLAEVMSMMEAAEQGRGRYVRIADRMAKLYSPAVHLIAFTSFLGWLLASGGDWHRALTIAVAVLIITCPCALGLAVPVAHVIGASRLFAGGILMKDGSALERLALADCAVFDKTGTLTTGSPTLKHSSLPDGYQASWARALALRSAHPAARAVAAALGDVPDASPEQVHEHPGLGVEAVIQGRRVRLGRSSWIEGLCPGAMQDFPEAGLTFAVEGERPSRFLLSETLRPGVAEVIKDLTDRHIPCAILSGDGEMAVAGIAGLAGVEHWRAQLQPGEKLRAVEEMSAAGRHVLMVGDGINDSPALSAAHVSMAPASASDAGRIAADFVFTHGDLRAVTYALRVARSTGAIVKQNFALAIAYNVLAVPLAIAGYLNPLIAAVAMSSSSILVVGNSLRLHWLKPAKKDMPDKRPLTIRPQSVKVAG